MGRRLTVKQKKFCAYHAELGNAAQAAYLAGYSGSYNTLKSVGSENLTKPDIQAELSRIWEEGYMPKYEVMGRMSGMARGEIPTREDETKDGIMKHYDALTPLTAIGKTMGVIKAPIEIGEETLKTLLIDAPIPIPTEETEDPEKT